MSDRQFRILTFMLGWIIGTLTINVWVNMYIAWKP